ncbi:MAG: hypothetical protein PHE49_00565 [bacterium]|nr:hypothetical protein [bacterium]
MQRILLCIKYKKTSFFPEMLTIGKYGISICVGIDCPFAFAQDNNP